MSSSLSPVSMFYKQVGDFKDKIILILQQLHDDQVGGSSLIDDKGEPIDFQSEIKTIKKYHMKLRLAKTANSRLPIELFYEHVVKTYADQILSQNETFFLGTLDTYLTDPTQLSTLTPPVDSGIDPKDMMFLGQIKIIMSHLNDETQIKQNIWTYVKVMCLLAEKIMVEKDPTCTYLAQAKQKLA
jgi:hypothetical protein